MNGRTQQERQLRGHGRLDWDLVGKIKICTCDD